MLQNEDQQEPLRPFLKWAGGKRWLAAGHPELFLRQADRYIEPFLGGGAVFFALQPIQAILSDTNPRLIEAYVAIRTDWRAVWKCLRRHHRNHNEAYYYVERSRSHRALHERAAQFLYLNRTCWNGLYRENKRGVFNVPIGTKAWAVSEDDNFEAVSSSLKNTILKCQDFEATLEDSKRGDFVFVDPPYTVAHNFNGFVKYNQNIFSWQDQIRLRDCLVRARKRGAEILVTNANHQSVRELYTPHGVIKEVSRASVIGSKSVYRRPTTELLITLEP